MYTRSRLFVFLFMIASLLLTNSFLLNPGLTSATLVWSDAFNDGNHDGWTVTYGNFSCSDNALISTQYSSAINHPSSVTVGTWSFDLLLVDSGTSGVHICFYCESMVFYPITGYDLKVSRSGFELMYWLDYYDDSIGEYFPRFVMDGWQHIDITRDNTGLIRVYINQTLRIETVDNHIPSSNYFHLLSGPSEGLDNIRVTDSIDITPPPENEFGEPTLPPVTYLILGVLALCGVTVLGVSIILHRRRKSS